MYDLIGSGKIIKTELEFLVECVRAMRDIRTNQGFAAGEAFQKQMEAYFGLGIEMRNTFVYDELLRLSDTPAGTLVERDDALLQRLHAMQQGQRFLIENQPCTFVRHLRTGVGDRDGFFEYVYEGTTQYRPLRYQEAWTMANAGRLSFG